MPVSIKNADEIEKILTETEVYSKYGLHQKAAEHLQRVFELDPENAHMVFFNLGALIIKNDNRTEEDTRKAIGAFRKAVEINPSYARAYRELAFALLGVGDRAGAREALEQYVEVAPDAPDAKQMEALIKSLPEA